MGRQWPVALSASPPGPSRPVTQPLVIRGSVATSQPPALMLSPTRLASGVPPLPASLFFRSLHPAHSSSPLPAALGWVRALPISMAPVLA